MTVRWQSHCKFYESNEFLIVLGFKFAHKNTAECVCFCSSLFYRHDTSFAIKYTRQDHIEDIVT